MNIPQRIGLSALVGVLLVGLAWMGMRVADTGPDLDDLPAPDVRIAPTPIADGTHGADGTDAAGGHADPVAQAFGQQDTDEGMDHGDRLVRGGLTPGDRRANRVERSVHLILGTVAPELDLDDVKRTCSPDGRHCTFDGPWPGDDFLGRWIRATSAGEISSDELGGVTFERFEPVEADNGQRRFEIIAVLKPPSLQAP